MVRAKFVVTSIETQMGTVKDQETGEYKPSPIQTIKMQPVYANNDPNHENSKFWAASPGGRLELNCVNPKAVEQFTLGTEFYVDFTPAPEKA